MPGRLLRLSAPLVMTAALVGCAAAGQDPSSAEWIAFHAEVGGNLDIYAIHPDGSGLVQLTNDPAHDGFPVYSPDGTQIAFLSDRAGDLDVWVMRADGSNQTRLTDQTGLDRGPVWSPDGSQIAFVSTRDGTLDVFVMDADGSNQRALTDSTGWEEVVSWSPDGKYIVYQSNRSGDARNPQYSVYTVDVTTGESTQVTNFVNPSVQPAWSPDGQRIAFVLVRSLPDDPETLVHDIHTINPDGSDLDAHTENMGVAANPVWSPDGTRIAFTAQQEGTSAVYVVDPATDERVRISENDQEDSFVTWSPDGTRVAYAATNVNGSSIYVAQADGGTLQRLQVQNATEIGAPNWKPAG